MATQEVVSQSNPEKKTDTLTDMANVLLGEIAEIEETNETEDDQDEDTGSPIGHEELKESETGDKGEGEPSEDGEVTWALALGIDDDKVDVDEDGNLKGIRVKVDKHETIVPVSELIAGYQTSKSFTQKTQRLAEQRKEFENVRDYAINEYTKKLDDVNKLSEILESELIAEYKGVNWEQLRIANPGEYAAMVQDFQIKQQRISGIKSAIQTEREREFANMQNNQQQVSNQYLENQVNMVIEKNPTWKDPKVFKQVIGELKEFIGETYGFTEEEFNNINDARMFEVVKDARAYRMGVQTAQKKLTKQIPKFQKPGVGSTTPKVTKLDKLVNAAKRAQPGTRKRELESSAIAALLMGET